MKMYKCLFILLSVLLIAGCKKDSSSSGSNISIDESTPEEVSYEWEDSFEDIVSGLEEGNDVLNLFPEGDIPGENESSDTNLLTVASGSEEDSRGDENSPEDITSALNPPMLSGDSGGQDLSFTPEIEVCSLPYSNSFAPEINDELTHIIPIPEPSTIVLLGIGIAGFAAAKLKRRKK